MSALQKAMAAWGTDMPDWIHILAEACDGSSQKKVSMQIGFSAGAVNQVLSQSYNAGLGAIKQAVEGALMNATVDCPVMGEMPANVCLENQKREFAATNSTRVRLYKACRGGCPHSRLAPSSASIQSIPGHNSRIGGR